MSNTGDSPSFNVGYLAGNREKQHRVDKWKVKDKGVDFFYHIAWWCAADRRNNRRAQERNSRQKMGLQWFGRPYKKRTMKIVNQVPFASINIDPHYYHD